MNIKGWFSAAANWFTSFFKNHQVQIQTAVQDAKIVATVAASVAVVAGEPEAANLISKVNDGLTILGVAAQNAANNQTLLDHANNIANAVTTLVDHGDVGVKNADVKAKITDVANKATGVVSVVQAVTG